MPTASFIGKQQHLHKSNVLKGAKLVVKHVVDCSGNYQNKVKRLVFANSQVFCCKVSSISQSCHIITVFENHSKKSHSQCLKITQQSLIHSV